MDNKELAQVNNQSLGPLNDLQMALGKEIFKINMLRAYPLSDLDIIDWAKMINAIMPDVTPENINEAITGLANGLYYYDKHLGIQNLIKALKVMDGSDFLDRL